MGTMTYAFTHMGNFLLLLLFCPPRDGRNTEIQVKKPIGKLAKKIERRTDGLVAQVEVNWGDDRQA